MPHRAGGLRAAKLTWLRETQCRDVQLGNSAFKFADEGVAGTLGAFIYESDEGLCDRSEVLRLHAGRLELRLGECSPYA
jgi:hypothetical protein